MLHHALLWLLHHALLWLFNIMHCYGLPQHALGGGGRNKRGVHLVSLYFRAATTVLREHPAENHAVLKYGSTSTLSDFVQILCRVSL